MEAKKLTKLVKIVTSLATVFLFLLVSIIIFEYIKINSLSKKLDDITSLIEEKEAALYDVNTNTKNHSEQEYMEDFARRELGYLDDKEVYIIFEK